MAIPISCVFTVLFKKNLLIKKKSHAVLRFFYSKNDIFVLNKGISTYRKSKQSRCLPFDSNAILMLETSIFYESLIN